VEVKLLLMGVMLRFDIAFPEGQTKRNRDAVEEKLETRLTQRFVSAPSVNMGLLCSKTCVTFAKPLSDKGFHARGEWE
jgi:hypothetical protein